MLRNGMFLADRYEILEQIGTGGMADVYKAKCHKLNRFVAIKVLKSEFSQDKTFVSKFRAEAQSAAGLTHSNIVNVYDVGDENGIYYIVMELVEGITLKKYIEKRGKIPYKETVSIAIQVANGMDAAHKHHIIHRDIKPQNIIISKDGKVKVTDFGIAKAASSSTINSSSAMGSVHYISPEQARGGYSDERSDIYSLGVTMFEMLTGSIPFDGDSAVSVAVQHIQDEIPAPSMLVDNVPISIDNIVLKCVCKKVDNRYQTAGELILDLKRALVSPDEDFVKFSPMYAAGGNAASVAVDKVMEVRASGLPNKPKVEEDDDFLLGDDKVEDVQDYTIKRYEKTYIANKAEDVLDEEKSDIDDSDIVEENNDKLDLIMKIIGIGIAAIILVITIFVIAKVFNTGNNNQGNKETTISETATSESGDKVTVPNVAGMTKDDAIAALNKEGLGYRTITQKSSTVDEGKVISQGTNPGTKVNKNTQIVLTISSGKEVVTAPVPDVSGMSESAATATLKAAGFDVSVEYAYSDSVNSGNVIKSSASGSLSVGSTVVITVSQGKEVKKITMENLVDKTESEAIQWLDANNLKWNVTYVTTSGTYGKVVSQDKSAGTTLEEGESVKLVVSHNEVPSTTVPATQAPATTAASTAATTQSTTEATQTEPKTEATTAQPATTGATETTAAAAN